MDSANSYFSWPAILAGSALALAITVVLNAFGAGSGLVYDAGWLDRDMAYIAVWAAGLFVVLTALASSTAGGYVAGRMRPRWTDAKPEEVEIRDGCNGLAVWAVSTVIMSAAVAIMSALAAIAATGQPGTAELSATQAAMGENAATVLAFAAGSGSALGAAAAWFAAKQGGEHRDENISIAELTPRFLRR